MVQDREACLQHKIFVFTFALIVGNNLHAEPLIAALGDSWSMPYAQISYVHGRGSLTGGIIYDWYQALAKQLQRPISIQIMPPKRVSLMYQLGRMDLRCFTTPAWSPVEMSSLYRWTSQPILQIEERLVGLRDMPVVNDVEQLRARSVGTVAGYYYPLLESWFQDSKIKRDDGPSEMTVLEKQLMHRTDYSIVRTHSLQYLQSQDARWQNLQVSPLVVSSTSLYCATRNASSLAADALETAQSALLAQGVMQRIVDRYR